MHRRSRRIVTVALFVFVCLYAPTAFAFDESTSTVPSFNITNCGGCHNPYFSVGTCIHGNYSATTDKCESCHTVHVAPAGGVMLLPGSTIQATCFTCHDGTQGRGVYGAISARGLTVGAKHRTETTSVVPGGSASNGGSATILFSGTGGTLTCSDCHSPHGADIVGAFRGDRYRYSGWGVPPDSGRLLKKRPTGATVSTAEYGSDWCLACHKGRSSAIPTVMNHPVDSIDETPTPYVYKNAAIMASDAATSVVTTGSVGGTNNGYLMPFPRKPLQVGHAPICQQCHEDARNVGTLASGGLAADATTFTYAKDDGFTASNSPRFGNFPHETQNFRFLVEATATATTDDLCTNCHPVEALP